MNNLRKYFALVLSLLLAAFAAGCAHNTTIGQKFDDTAITTKVKAALLGDPDVKSSAISVETLEGAVQLSGFVSSQTQAQRAVDITRRVDGVKQVINKMTVKAGANASTTQFASLRAAWA